MKKITLLLFFWAFALAIFAQSQTLTPAQQATEQLTAVYQFTPEQVQQIQKIQDRRFKNMAEIAPLQVSQLDLYIKKRKSIEYGTEASIKRLLNTSQLEIFNAKVAERRKARSVKAKELYREGLSKEEVELRLLDLE